MQCGQSSSGWLIALYALYIIIIQGCIQELCVGGGEIEGKGFKGGRMYIPPWMQPCYSSEMEE